jgi:hyperosmotically inducible periplasmic protein
MDTRNAMKKPTITAIFLSSLISAPLALAQSASTVAPDNAKTNKAYTSSAATADAQPNNATDLDLTKRIRQSVMADKSLSTYAHNVKIVTVNGSVTLNGVVRSEDEKGAVEKKAAEIAGASKVTNDLTVAPSGH